MTVEHKNLTGADLHICKTHASTHAKGATDPIAIDTLDNPTDNTDLNVSTSVHGLCPKLPNDSSKFLNGIGGWGVPGGAPVGASMLWFTETPPTGWVELNGASLSRTTYADLFAVLGTRYGTVDANHFTLPDMRGYFPRGWDHGRGIDPNKATRTDRGDGTVGDAVGTKQAEGVLSHRHTAGNATTFQDEMYGDKGLVGNGKGAATYTGYYGGNETRPININVMFIMKY